MSMRRVTTPKPGARKIKQSFLKRMANMAMRNDVMTLGSGIGAIFNDSFTAQMVAQPQNWEIIVVRLTADIFPRFSSEVNESSDSSESSGQSSDETGDSSAKIQEWNEDDSRWEDSSEEVRVFDAYDLCYDRDSYQICFMHNDSQNYYIIPQMTVRLAVTVADVDGEYPEELTAEGSSEGEQILSYAIRFVNAPYEKRDGVTEREAEQKEGTQDDQPHAYALNLIDFYIEEGSLIFVFWQNGQWYTAHACGFTGKRPVVTHVECDSTEGLIVDEVTHVYRSGHLIRIEDEEESEAVTGESEGSGYHPT